jgi:hypothetical protein
MQVQERVLWLPLWVKTGVWSNSRLSFRSVSEFRNMLVSASGFKIEVI